MYFQFESNGTCFWQLEKNMNVKWKRPPKMKSSLRFVVFFYWLAPILCTSVCVLGVASILFLSLNSNFTISRLLRKINKKETEKSNRNKTLSRYLPSFHHFKVHFRWETKESKYFRQREKHLSLAPGIPWTLNSNCMGLNELFDRSPFSCSFENSISSDENIWFGSVSERK